MAARQYIAVIADMVRSRQLSSYRRRAIQGKFGDLINSLNHEYRKTIAAKFIITLGDEFQGLLNSAALIPDLIWRLDFDFNERNLRVGVGCGTLDTPLQRYAINIDGSALHAAREAIDTAKREKTLGGVFCGFGEWGSVLNGIARILWFQRSGWTPSQREIAQLLRSGMSQVAIAETLRIRPQVVSRQVQSSGCMQYFAAENAWRLIFQKQIDPLLRNKNGRAKLR